MTRAEQTVILAASAAVLALVILLLTWDFSLFPAPGDPEWGSVQWPQVQSCVPLHPEDMAGWVISPPDGVG